MAMFDALGYCPANAFRLYEGETNPNWERTHEVLGDRIEYMIYTSGGSWIQGVSIVDCLKGGTGTLGIELATVLTIMIPECKYAQTGKIIMLTDVVSESHFPGNCRHYADIRYVVGIADDPAGVRMFFHKK